MAGNAVRPKWDKKAECDRARPNGDQRHHGAPRAAPRRPLLILNNGSDGSLLDMWLWGGAAATSRGYDRLTFDGPSQGYALWKQKLYFRPDWNRRVPAYETSASLIGLIRRFRSMGDWMRLIDLWRSQRAAISI